MYRSILTALAAGVILLAFAALPPMLPGPTPLSLSGSAQAQKTTPTTNATNLNTSRSNIYLEAAPDGTTPPKKQGKTKQPTTGEPAAQRLPTGVNNVTR